MMWPFNEISTTAHDSNVPPRPQRVNRKSRQATKRDGIKKDREAGCRCPNVKYYVTEDDDGLHVIGKPHRDDCPLRSPVQHPPLALPPNARPDTRTPLWLPNQ